MSQEGEATIKKLMEAHAQRMAAGRTQQEQAADEDTAFIAAFEQIRKDVIRPEMEKVRDQLTAGGHSADITEHDPLLQGVERISDKYPTIKMTISVAGPEAGAYIANTDASVIIFAGDTDNKEIVVYDAVDGVRGTMPLEKATAWRIEQEIINTLSRIFSTSYSAR